jgi:transposase InsO family protein
MDRQYTKHPSWGVKRMKFWLQRKGIRVNLKRVRRLLRLMGAGFGELGHRSRFNSASGTVNSATSVRVNSVEPDSV